MLIEIKAQVDFESPLHIGSGSLADAIADKPLLKDSRKLPLIPGSSLKGKTRHAAEQIIRSIIDRKWSWACNAPYPDQICKGDDPALLCPVCRIFGAPSYPSPMRFGNLTSQLVSGLQKPTGWNVQPKSEIRAGGGLNRGQRTAQEDILYTVETYRLSPALTLCGIINGELSERREVALLVAALRAIRTLGGNRSRGLGWCNFIMTVNIDKTEQDISELLKELTQWSS